MFKEGSEPDIYRDNLTEELKDAPKEERGEILEQAKETPEYQIARNKKIEGRQEEELINEGEGVFIKHKILYHGSGTPGLKKKGLKIWDDNRNTTGEGLYFTSEAGKAIGYAVGRTGQGRGDHPSKDQRPTLYECSVENMKLADLRKTENIKKIMPGWEKILAQTLNEPVGKKHYVENAINNALYAMKVEDINGGNLAKIIGGFNDFFTSYIKSLGYDGLMTLEGGEVGYVGDHDSYVIFDPEKVKIIKEQKIKKENK